MAVRISIFLSAAVVIGIGFVGMGQMEKDAGMAFLLGAMTLGGGLLICGLFSLKMQWHGMIGAGVLAMLGVGRGVLNLPGLAKFLVGDQSRGNAPLLELVVTIMCTVLLLRIWGAWKTERGHRLRDEH